LNKLKLLSQMKRQFNGVDPVFDSLFDGVQSVARLRRVGTGFDVWIEHDGNRIGWLQESKEDWKSRMDEFVSIAMKSGGNGLLIKMLKADGWVWNRVSLIAPYWMEPHVEIPLSEVVSVFPMLDFMCHSV
jgi:hypothetical protein